MTVCPENNPKYKVVELSTVTEETIELALNRWSSDGWVFDQIQFVVRDASRRPSMAFIFFIKPRDPADDAPDYETVREEPEETECEGNEEISNEIDLS